MNSNKGDKFAEMALESERRKDEALSRGNNGMIPHDLWNRIIPITQEYRRSTADIALLYSYLIARANGQPDNNRYMSAFAGRDNIAENTGISRNRVTALADILEFSGLIKTAYDYTSNKRDKLYYPQYYSDVSDEEIHENMRKWITKY